MSQESRGAPRAALSPCLPARVLWAETVLCTSENKASLPFPSQLMGISGLVLRTSGGWASRGPGNLGLRDFRRRRGAWGGRWPGDSTAALEVTSGGPCWALLCAELPGVQRAGDSDGERGVCVGNGGPISAAVWRLSSTSRLRLQGQNSEGDQETSSHAWAEKKRSQTLKSQEGAGPKKMIDQRCSWN